MKVKELIEILKTKDPDDLVCVKDGFAKGWYTDKIDTERVKYRDHLKYGNVVIDSAVSEKYPEESLSTKEQEAWLLY